jgi:hypothetical protein
MVCLIWSWKPLCLPFFLLDHHICWSQGSVVNCEIFFFDQGNCEAKAPQQILLTQTTKRRTCTVLKAKNRG